MVRVIQKGGGKLVLERDVWSCSGHIPFLMICCSSFSPTDSKLATSSVDGTVRIFDFISCSEEFILRGTKLTLYYRASVSIVLCANVLQDVCFTLLLMFSLLLHTEYGNVHLVHMYLHGTAVPV